MPSTLTSVFVHAIQEDPSSTLSAPLSHALPTEPGSTLTSPLSHTIETIPGSTLSSPMSHTIDTGYMIAKGVDFTTGQEVLLPSDTTLVNTDGNIISWTGINGTTGIRGVTGLIGATGLVGSPPQGETGLQGLTGSQGLTGLQGLTGIGINSDISGATGIQGNTGLQNNTGLQGNTGISNVVGLQGNTGIIGVNIPGFTGIQGEIDKLVGVQTTTTSSQLTATGIIAVDDTIPQNTEGHEILSLSYTPASTSNTLIIEAVGFWTQTTTPASTEVVIALFTSDSANAIAATTQTSTNGQGDLFKIRAILTAPSTSSLTISARLGSADGATIVLNEGPSGAFNTANLATLSVTEIEP